MVTQIGCIHNIKLLHISAVVSIILQNVVLRSVKFCNVICSTENLNK
jgi:hypothetical protein